MVITVCAIPDLVLLSHWIDQNSVGKSPAMTPTIWIHHAISRCHDEKRSALTTFPRRKLRSESAFLLAPAGPSLGAFEVELILVV